MARLYKCSLAIALNTRHIVNKLLVYISKDYPPAQAPPLLLLLAEVA